MSIFNIALSGFRASEYAKLIISNNVANANNPFYTRRAIDFTEGMGGQLSGVSIGDVSRIVNDAYNQQLLNSKFDIAKAQTYLDRLSHFESYIDNEDTSVIKFINESNNALDAVNATPGSIQGRNHYLNQLDNMVRRFQDVDARLKSDVDNTKREISAGLDKANTILSKIAELNKTIVTQNGQEESTKLPLYDQRDQYLSELAGLIDFEHQVNDEGQVDIQLNNGISLLVNNIPGKLAVFPGGNPSEMEISLQTKNGFEKINPFISSGSIVGLIDYHHILMESQHQIDRIALTIAQKLNVQNKLGIDANGELGGLIFNNTNDSTMVANRYIAKSTNIGSATMSVFIDLPDALLNTEYELQFDSATHYNLIRKSDQQNVGTGDVLGFPHSIIADGFTARIDAGTFNANDTYIITPSKDAARRMNMVMKNGDKLALGLPVITSSAKTNQGNGEMRLDSVIDTSNPAFSVSKQLNPPIRLEFITSTTYQLVNANDNSVLEGGLTYDPVTGSDIFPTAGGYEPGYRVQLTGDMKAGDSFNIQYNTNGLGDSRNGFLVADLYGPSANSPGFTKLYQGFEFDFSAAVNAANVNYESSKILNEQAQFRRDEISAVSLTEEMMNMSRYQEFYMANAQVMSTVSQTMDTLFSLLRG